MTSYKWRSLYDCVCVVLSVSSLNNSHLVGLLLGTQESCPHILAVSCLLLDFLNSQTCSLWTGKIGNCMGPQAIRGPLRADKLSSTAVSQNVATTVTTAPSFLNNQRSICNDISEGNLLKGAPY